MTFNTIHDSCVTRLRPTCSRITLYPWPTVHLPKQAWFVLHKGWLSALEIGLDITFYTHIWLSDFNTTHFAGQIKLGGLHYNNSIMTDRLGLLYMQWRICLFGRVGSSGVTNFRLVPTSVTLNDLERRNGRYFALFCRIR